MAGSPVFEKRLERLQQQLKAQGFAAATVNAGPTLTYLTGLHFHLMERPVVLTIARGTEPVLVLPELEQSRAEQLPFPAKLYPYGEDTRGWGDVFRDALRNLALEGKPVAVEPRQLRLLEYTYLREAAPADYIDGSRLFASLRARKDAAEIERIRTAVGIAERALEATVPSLRIGLSESEIANELFIQLMRAGSGTELPFSPIVASGPNSADPHATPGDRRLASGDLLIVDWGASYDGYMADLTRTFAVGGLDAELVRIHTTVQGANEAGRAAGKRGVACSAVDAAARRHIETAGYGTYFTHRTGHGLGMDCHEDPYITQTNDEALEEGMVYTVEPGIYLGGRGGVRIEDDVVITASGAESLSTMERGIRIVG